jgi:hypothetical protein
MQDGRFIEDAAILTSFWKEVGVRKSKMKPKQIQKPSDQWLREFIVLHLYCLTVGYYIEERQEFFLSNALVDNDSEGDEDAEGDTDDEGPRFLIGMVICLLYSCIIFKKNSLHQRREGDKKKASGQ